MPLRYTGKSENKSADLQGSRRARQNSPAGYIADQGLIDAVNVALLLEQPLLLTGEPGTGKTQLASSVSWELGFGPPLMFETKSTSVARDLFYTYDTLGRFHAAQLKTGSADSLDYITYNALGIAILRANETKDVAEWLPKGVDHGGKQRSIVLIDEVDKAPRDFPNDILNEVEHMYFKIPELGNAKISAGSDMRPILIITSNSEKHLPDAFLRRCVYYNIPFPNKTRLAEIVETRIGEFHSGASSWLDDALDFFTYVREPKRLLSKRPATAELLGWLIAMREMWREEAAEPDSPLSKYPKIIRSSLSALVKSAEDQNKAGIILNEWLEEKVNDTRSPDARRPERPR